jgi:DNA repair photolyase
MFANDISERWIIETLNHCRKFDNTYLFQTKNPAKPQYFTEFPDKSVFCTTIETNRVYPEIMRCCPTPNKRAIEMNEIGHLGYKTYVTIEPIMDFDLAEMLYLIETCLPEQVNIGADSGKNNLPEPGKEKLLALIEGLEKFTTIARKTNLARLLV